MADDIRLSATERRPSASGVWLVGWIAGGIPVSVDPAGLYPTAGQIGAVTLGEFSLALLAKQDTSQRGLANGYASLDANGRVPVAQLPAASGGGAVVSNASPQPLAQTASPGVSLDASRADHVHRLPTPEAIGAAPITHTHAISAVLGLQTALDGKLGSSVVGVAGGLVPLGTDLKVPNQYLPAGISPASLDLKADLSYVNSQLATKANSADLTSGLAGKASSTDTRLVNAVQPDFKATIETISANYAAVAGDANKIKRYAGTTDIQITLPALAVGTTLRFLQANTGRMTFVAGTSQTVSSFGDVFQTAGKSANVIATCDATNSWNLSGNLA